MITLAGRKTITINKTLTQKMMVLHTLKLEKHIKGMV